ADAQRVRAEFWENLILHVCNKATFLRKKRPPPTFEWLLATTKGAENLQRVLDGEFDRDFNSRADTPGGADTRSADTPKTKEHEPNCACMRCASKRSLDELRAAKAGAGLSAIGSVIA